ncbi:GIY-YIG nuclease family protein [Priestia flexa]|uniref:GIY-YIG nuclease family protein n=1 Tax=Priestia flexa TaxID=86664 RepID=UPI003D2EBE0C
MRKLKEELVVHKVGVVKSEAERRIFEARTTFKKHFNNDKFNQIKIIQSPNALNLEVYLKRLFKKYRQPLLESTEWFLLDYDATSYMKEEKYFRDADFMKIHNFVVDTD